MGGETSKKLREHVDRLADNDSGFVEVNWEGLKIGDRGVAALSEALRTNTRLRNLRLGGCAITQVGARSLTDAICQSQNNRVRKLDFTTSKFPRQGNPLGNEGAASLAEVLTDHYTQLHILVLRNCNIGDEGATAITNALKTNQTLLTLELGDNLISNSGAEEIGKALIENCTLKGLSLWHNRIFPDGAEGLAEGLRHNSTLEWLGLGCNHISDIGLKAICEALQANCENSRLTWLALGGNNITDRGVKHLAFLLKGSLEREDSDEVETQLNTRTLVGASCRLESIGLGGNDVSNTGAGQLAEALQHNSVLKSLGLADNRIGDEGAITLASAVHDSESLETLVVSGNDIGDDGASQLAAALAKNRSLKSLFLAENDFSDDTGKRFVEVLSKHNSTLKTLDIHNSAISPDGMKEVVDALQGTHLTTVGGELSYIKLKSRSSRISMSGNVLPVEARETVPSGSTIFRSTAPGWGQSHKTMDSLPEDAETHEKRSTTELAVEAFQEARTRSLDSGDSHVLVARERGVKKAVDKFLSLRLVSQQDPLFEQQRQSSQPAQDETSFITSSVDSKPSTSTNHSSEQYYNSSSDDDDNPATITGSVDKQSNEVQPGNDRLPDSIVTRSMNGSNSVVSDGNMNMPLHGMVGDTHDSVGERFEDISRSVSQSSGLSHLTKDRPQQSGKRKPSRSASGTSIEDSKPTQHPMEDEETVINQSDHVTGRQGDGEIHADLHTVRMENLKQRVSIVQLGGSLQNLFDQIVAKDDSYNHDFTTARLPENSNKNCYDVNTPLPPERSRVKLTVIEEMKSSDYINASFVGPLDEPNRFIVAQSPLEDTVQDFWRMIWEQCIRVIIMLGKHVEGGEVKCESYWPDWEGPGDDYGLARASGPGKPGQWAPGALHVTSTRQRDEQTRGVKLREFTLEHTQTEDIRTVAMYQFVDWMDYGVPSSVEAVVELVRLVEKKREDVNKEWPLLVHGYIGAGRCGSFCAIMMATEILSKRSTSTLKTISQSAHVIDDVISTIRSQRPGLVHSACQFEFVHQAVYHAVNPSVHKIGRGSDKEDGSNEKKGKKKNSWFKRGGKKGQGDSRKESKGSSSSGGKSKFSLFGRKTGSSSRADSATQVSDEPVFDDALY